MPCEYVLIHIIFLCFQIQMAYGMQIPQVPFSYFYPTKIPPPSGGAGISGAPSSHSTLTSTVSPNDAKASNTTAAGHYPKLVAPLNFSKREAELKYDMVDIEQKLYHRDYDSPSSAVSKHQSPASQHEQKSDLSEQEVIVEENENVEIDWRGWQINNNNNTKKNRLQLLNVSLSIYRIIRVEWEVVTKKTHL